MPFDFNDFDCTPLVFDHEFDINDEDLLAEYVGKIILGHYAHVKRIINALSVTSIIVEDSDFDFAIARLDSVANPDLDIEKRDGWLFQIISWLALLHQNQGKAFHCQQPHDAPAQHGIDGVALTLDDASKIESIIITEDKCTENQRVVIPKIWNEFEDFENGVHTNQLVSRISAMIENLDGGDILDANKNDIYKKELWKYRVGINRNDTYEDKAKRLKLFKGYDGCVTGIAPHRRFASTMFQDDIRGWMEDFSQKVIESLENEKENV